MSMIVAGVMVEILVAAQRYQSPAAKVLENIFMILLIFVDNIEDVVEPDPSIMPMIGGV